LAVFAGRERVAFDDGVVQPDELPLFAPVTFEVDLANHQADAHDASLNVVIVRLVVWSGGRYRYILAAGGNDGDVCGEKDQQQKKEGGV